jgi:potassium-transporting ATPase KdpC subunit
VPAQANGSQVLVDGKPVGSSRIGQSFTDDDGAALPGWFQSRPSAFEYDGAHSGGSNLGPENDSLVAAINDRRGAIAAFNDVDARAIPPDALTASASGLDPHISPEYARLQVKRVAAFRGLKEPDVTSLVDSFVQERTLGFLGERTVNVLELNIALDRMDAND